MPDVTGTPCRKAAPLTLAVEPLDKVNRQFRVPAPNMLWVSDFTYVATWRGFVDVAFVIDAYARRIVGWRVCTSAHAGFFLDALEQAVHERRPAKGMGLVHHSDRGSQYLSINYAMLQWVDWFNNRRLLESIGNIPPAEAEANIYATLETEPMAA